MKFEAYNFLINFLLLIFYTHFYFVLKIRGIIRRLEKQFQLVVTKRLPRPSACWTLMTTFDRKETEQVATFLWQVLVIPTSSFANQASKLSQSSSVSMSTSSSEMETPAAKMPSQTSG